MFAVETPVAVKSLEHYEEVLDVAEELTEDSIVRRYLCVHVL